MNILAKIAASKMKEVPERKRLYPIKLLEKSLWFSSPCVSLRDYLLRDDLFGLISEFKRKSPSAGNINMYADVEKTTLGYMQSGSSGLSILTDREFFGGCNEDLTQARRFNFCPILRKDFIVDEYQIIEARSIGADAVLLIAALLSADQLKKFTVLATTLGMETVVEIHEKAEISSIPSENVIVGVNNRNLKTFEVEIENSISLFPALPKDCVKISESGIKHPADALKLKDCGFNGFLMGSEFMRHGRPDLACRAFINDARRDIKIRTNEVKD